MERAKSACNVTMSFHSPARSTQGWNSWVSGTKIDDLNTKLDYKISVQKEILGKTGHE